jgi:hypothetical protein
VHSQALLGLRAWTWGQLSVFGARFLVYEIDPQLFPQIAFEIQSGPFMSLTTFGKLSELRPNPPPKDFVSGA